MCDIYLLALYHYSIIQIDAAADLPQLLSALPTWRREQAEAFRFDRGQRECAEAYLLLCRMLREHYGVCEQPEFVTGEHGKPALLFRTEEGRKKGNGLTFNMSHCKNGIGCIVSDCGDVGIDVECLERYKESLADYCMSEEENSRIKSAADPDALFSELWTRKEALLKCTGEGITDDLKTCLQTARMAGMEMISGVNHTEKYAWAVCVRKTTNEGEAASLHTEKEQQNK